MGNRLADAAFTGYSYDDGNRMLGNSAFSFSHDAHGSIIRRTETATGDAAALTYDAENRLTRVDRPDGAHVAIKYDAQGRRVEKVFVEGAQTTTRRYVYDAEDILALLDGNNALLAWFAHGPGIDESLMMLDQGRPRFLFADGLGSVTAVTEQDGTVIERIEHEAYGTPTFIDLTGGVPAFSNASVTANPHAFKGRPWDHEVGLADHRERVRDPETGGFLQADPIGLEGGLNLFSYTENNPLNRIDPYGWDYLEFGRTSEQLTWVVESNGTEVDRKSWPAFSGIRGLYAQIPVGTYYTSPTDREVRTPIKGWGPLAYRLHESAFTRISRWRSGRTGGFFIHGGFGPGTAGCIEFKDYERAQMFLFEFDSLMRNYGKSIRLKVTN